MNGYIVSNEGILKEITISEATVYITSIALSIHPLTKTQNDRHLLNFYLSESRKSLNNSQLYKFCNASFVWAVLKLFHIQPLMEAQY